MLHEDIGNKCDINSEMSPSENFPANNDPFMLSVAATLGMASIGTHGTMVGLLPAGSL